MKLLADVHISPRTATFLRGLGHDVVRVGPDYLRSTASDADIVAVAITDERSSSRRTSLLRDRDTLRFHAPFGRVASASDREDRDGERRARTRASDDRNRSRSTHSSPWRSTKSASGGCRSR